MKILKISITAFELTFNNFDGYGFSLFNIHTGNFSGSLLHFSLRKTYKDKGEILKMNLNIFFIFAIYRILKIIKPPQNYCETCEDYFFRKTIY